MSTGFIDFFVKQGFDDELVSWLFFAAGFAVLFALLATLLPMRQGRAGRFLSFTFAAGLPVVTFAAGVVLFEAVAAYLRTVPYGHGRHRQGADYEAFILHVQLAQLALYAAIASIALALGWLIGTRRSERRIWLPATAVAVVLAFMALTLPAVDWMNACYVGKAFVTDAYCE